MSELNTQLERYYQYYQQDTHNLGLLCKLIDLETEAGLISEAAEHIESGLHVWADETELLFRRATIHLLSQEYDKASQIYEDLINLGIDNEVIRLNLAHAYIYDGKYQKSCDLLAPVVPDIKQQYRILLMYSRSLHHIGNLTDAIKYALEFVQREPDDAEALGMLSLLYLDIQDNVNALHYAKKACVIDQSCRDALIVLGFLSLEELKTGDAIQYFESTVSKYPNCGRALSGLGLSFMMKQDLKEATIQLKAAVTYMPTHIGTWHALAWCQIVQDKIDDAESSFNLAMDIDHNFGETHGGLAVVMAIKGNTEEATRLIKVATRLDPGSQSAKFAESLLVQSSNPSKAKDLISEILSTQSGKEGLMLKELISNNISINRKH